MAPVVDDDAWLPGNQSHADAAVASVLWETSGQPVELRLRALADSVLGDLPLPGHGQTAQRLRVLSRIAADDLSLARLAEGHADALSILTEAGVSAPAGLVYGVWVAGPPPVLHSECQALSGRRPYCSGAGIIDRALVTGEASSQVFLTEVDVRRPEVMPLDGTWPSVGMSSTASFTIEFRRCPTLRHIGGAGFYRDRRGFWLGSLNVAACWFGGALGLARTYLRCSPSGPDASAMAEIDTSLRTMAMHLDAAATACDSGLTDEGAELTALRCRRAVYFGCNNVHDAVSEAGGTNLATHHAAQARRLADLPIYLRQFNRGSETRRLGELILDRPNRSL